MAKSKSTRSAKKASKLPDWYLWSEVTRSVSPLPRKTVLSRADIKGGKSLEDTKLKSSQPKPKPITWSPAAVTSHETQIKSQAQIIEPRMHRRLRRGQLPIDATIDLHGLRQDEARSALYRFIDARFGRGDRTLLVITGKGLKKAGYGEIVQKGVLRHMLPRWLKEPALAPLIAGWEVSARQHGGEGAFYVRLKRGRQ